MSKKTTPTSALSSASLYVVTHRIGDGWRCLFVSVEEDKEPEIVSAIEVDSDHELETLLAERNPDRIFSILPGSVTVCRTTTLPDIDDEQIHEALRLQAEARLLGSTPAHRRAFAPLDASVGETNRVGLIVTWPESSTLRIPSCLHDANLIPDTASVAALLDGFRPTEIILFADRSDGTITLALSHANGAALRATREDNSSPSIFLEGILRITKETASLHNHSVAFTQSLIDQVQSSLTSIGEETPMTLLPLTIIDGAAKRLKGSDATDHIWWRKWGIAVGGILAATGSLQSLTTIRAEAPVVHPSRVEWLTTKLSNRSTATRLVTAAILLLVFGPAVVAGIRLGLLQVMHPNLDAQYAQIVESRHRQVVYKELGESAWPMTKIIADVINNVPVGIEVDSLKLDVGNPISLRGRAIDNDKDGRSAAELIAGFQANLQSSGLFTDIQFSYDPAGTYGNRDFDLWATVVKPLKRPKYTSEQDFGKWTLAMRNEDGSSPFLSANADEIPNASDSPIPTTPEPRVRDRPRPRGGRESDAASHNEDRIGGGPPSRIPEPLSPQQIAVMSETEARVALSDVTAGLAHVGRDVEAKARLRIEMRHLLDRLKELQR